MKRKTSVLVLTEQLEHLGKILGIMQRISEKKIVSGDDEIICVGFNISLELEESILVGIEVKSSSFAPAKEIQNLCTEMVQES